MSASDSLDAFARDLGADAEAAEIDGEAIAVRLFEALNADRARYGIADLWHYGCSVEMELENGEFWAVECIGSDAFHFYPAVVRGDSVTWINVWVTDDYKLAKLMKVLTETLAKARLEAEKDL